MADQRITASYSSRYPFTAKEQDALTGLHYFGARYYDARISLWYGVDPMAEKFADWNPYNYTLDNPILLFDPDGNGPIKPNIIGIVAYKQNHPDSKAFEQRKLGFQASQSFTVHTGKEFIKALIEGSKKAPIDRLIVGSHSSGFGIYMNDDAGLYGDYSDLILKTWGSKEGAAILSEIGKSIENGDIRFSKEAQVIFAGCNTGDYPCPGLDGFAENFSEVVSNVYVTGANDKTNPYHSKDGKKDSNIYKTVNEGKKWNTYKNGKKVQVSENSINVVNFVGSDEKCE